MPIIERDYEQGTERWLSQRAGCPTASMFDRIVTGSTCKPSASQGPYIQQLVAEAFGEHSGVSTKEMEWGKQMEINAIACYELDQVVEVERVGFVWADDTKTWGCSPDGLIGKVGGIECKVPKIATHVGYLQADVIPAKYRSQVFGNLLVTGRDWWDFYSHCWDHRLPDFTRRTYADNKDFLKWKAKFEEVLPDFIKKLDKLRIRVGLPHLEDRFDPPTKSTTKLDADARAALPF